MNTPSYTKGQWAVSMPGGQTTFNGRRVTVTCNGSMIADFDWNSPQENMANAQLCASAPDLLAQRNALLEALQYIQDVLGSCAYFESKQIRRAFDKAQQAIALAQGGGK